MKGAPGYWMFETTGVLRPAVEAYLSGRAMSDEQIAAMRAYLRQWIEAPCWHGQTVVILRSLVDRLTTREAIERWLRLAERAGIDPL